jgi:hypothetical protein
MVFDTTTAIPKRKIGDELYQERCCTYEEAEAMHKRVVQMVKNGEIKKEE